MKIFKLMMLALVAMVGLNSCSDDCNHDFIEHDFTQDIVGTWTYLEEGQAEAMVIKADGSFTTTGVMRGGALYEEKGTIKVVNNKVTLAFDGDTDEFEGRLEFVAGKSMSLVMFDDNNVRLDYDYCENDLADEVVGMWVCADNEASAMAILTFDEEGKSIFTASHPDANVNMLNSETTYKVVGDLMFGKEEGVEGAQYITTRLIYNPNATSFGDILTQIMYLPTEFGVIENVSSWLRVKQSLNLTNKLYAYNTAYVTNAKGADEDFNILGNTFNMANIKSGNFDMMFRSELFCVDLNANTIKQHFLSNGRDIEIEIPITVDGNKVTLDLSTEIPACRKVEMYMFQDADDSQLHMYMPTSSFINYFANMELYTLIAQGKLDPTDTVAAEKVFSEMEARVESINVSFVFKAIEAAE